MRTRGFSLIEMLIVVAVLAIVASTAAPSFRAMTEKYRAKGVTEELYGDLVFARSEALKRRSAIHLSVKGDGAAWCYGLDTVAACDCLTGACSIKSVQADPRTAHGVALATDLPGGDTEISPRTGLPTAAGMLTVTDALGRSYGVRLTPIGMVRVCSNDFGGYPSCL